MKILDKSTFICDYFTIDASKKITLVGIFSNINAIKLPSVLNRFYFVSFLQVESDKDKFQPTKIKIDLEVRKPNNELVNKPFPGLELEIPSDKAKPVVAIEINNFEYDQWGNYEFVLKVDNKIINKTPLSVVLAK